MDSPAAPVTRSRKRKASSDKPVDARADRKRVQNRISQQCLREKQLAHTRQLESFIEIIKSTNDETKNNEDRYSTLLDAHLKLIEDKRQLEDALFRLRKRLLSLSNIASTAADDEIFTQLLDKDGRRRRSDNSETPSQPQAQTVNGAEEQQSKTSPTDAQKTLETIEDNPTGGAADSAIVSNNTGLQVQQHQLSSNRILDPGPPFDPDANSQSPDHGDGPLIQALDNECSDFIPVSGVRFGSSTDTSPPPYMIYDQVSTSLPTLSFDSVKTITVTSAVIFSDKVGSACRKYLSQVLGSQPSFDLSPISDEDSSLSSENMAARVVKQLAATSVYLFGAFSGMESYIYGVDAAPYMDRVMRWRISNTVANRLAIPEPFRPTPLQYNSPDHPITIDFINWPTIRDQLIIHLHSIDLDAIIKDIVLNTVVEIEHRKIAINVFDIFHNRILSSSSRTSGYPKNTAMVNPNWKFLELAPVGSLFEFSSDPIEDALVQEISWRMQFGLGGSSHPAHISTQFSSSDLDGSDTPFGLFPWWNPQFRKNEVASYFGIDRLNQWRLSPAFARKYPNFDCSAVVSAYEMVSCASATIF